jgi:VanZ family protein
MITNLLLEHSWMSTAVLALLVVTGPLLGKWLVPRPRVAWWLLGFSLIPVVVTTLIPVDRPVDAFCVVQWSVPTPTRVELMANVVLFVAPALLLAVITRRPMLALLVGAGLSIAIELVQALAPAIGRSCDTTDWLTNTIGAAIGAALGWAALRLARRPSAEPSDGLTGRVSPRRARGGG